MQKKLSAASNRAAVWELHAEGLSQRKIATVLHISKTRVTQILAEQPKQSGQGGQYKRDTKMTEVISRMPNIQLDIEKKVTEAAGNSAAQVLADEREAQRKQVLDDLQFIRNWSLVTAERVQRREIDVEYLQIELTTLKTLASVLHENNRQRIELFGLSQPKRQPKEISFNFDYVEAARRGGLDI
jgi:predicted transcriptional regulator